jgi:hypothetical protein
MSVSAVSGSGYESPDTQQTDRVVLALKKQQDAQTAQAQGLLALIQQAGAAQAPPQGKDGVGTLISVYA